VVVLHHHLVREIGAMPGAAGGEHGGDVERPESRGGLAGVEDAAGRTGDGAHVGAGGAGDSAGPLQQVEHRPLGSKDPPKRPAHHADHRAGADALTLGREPLDPAPAQGGHRVGERRSGEHPAAAELQPSLG
jgi:hypothetical protein